MVLIEVNKLWMVTNKENISKLFLFNFDF